MKVYVVTAGSYSDFHIVAIKSNEEAARILEGKCYRCLGTGTSPGFEGKPTPCFVCDGAGVSPYSSDGCKIAEWEMEDA